MNQLVKYDSELNTIFLQRLAFVEMNLFFSVNSRMRDDTVRFVYDQLKKLPKLKK
jgi:hypothetical protein